MPEENSSEPVEEPQPKSEEDLPALPDEQPAAPQNTGPSRLRRFKKWYGARKKWTIPATVIIVILILAGIPFTRYGLAGLVDKQNTTVKVLDATAGTPVSGATVSAAGQTAQTNAAGLASLHLKAGRHSFTITKKYYRAAQANVLTPILKQKSPASVSLTATGRQVKISVVNRISQKVLNGVNIKVAGTSAKTGRDGSATVVLPAGAAEQTADLSLNGYNDALVKIKVSDDKIQLNKFSLTPAGKVYFLSKLSGTIDVVKTNLDGTDRQTVLAGTGHEDDRGTVLLASRDWKYLALLSRRAGSTPSLYLINTANDKLTTIDSGNIGFDLVGWSDDNFVYIVYHNDVQPWQPHGQTLKSYNAAKQQLLTLDQTDGQGTDQLDYAEQDYGQVYELGNSLVYDKSWTSAYNDPTTLDGKTAGIYSINSDGTGAKTVQAFAYASGQSTYIESVPYQADEIYYSITEKGAQNYYVYSNGKLTAKDGIADQFNQYYNSPVTYLQSPDDTQTFWAEPRDGKNTLFVGNADGQNGQQIATLSDYNPYGWFTNNYLLVSKDASELYIMPVGGSAQPVKISDYHKPALSYAGYGGGYGGL